MMRRDLPIQDVGHHFRPTGWLGFLSVTLPSNAVLLCPRRLGVSVMAGWLASGLTLTISTGILINRTSNATNARTPRSHAVPCPPKEEWDLAPGLKPRPLDDRLALQEIGLPPLG
jgi:hypothetical protein